MKFSLPATAVVEHLVWGDDGVWACYEVAPSSYRYRPAREKVKLHRRIHAVLNAIPVEAMLAGIVEPYRWEDLEDAVVRSSPTAKTQWPAMAERQLHQVEELDLVRRRFVLAIRLDDDDAARGDRWRASKTGLLGAFGVPAGPPSAREVTARRRQAVELEGRLGSNLDLERVTPGFLRWMYGRVAERGLVSEPSFEASVWEPSRRETRRGDPVTVSMAQMWDFTIAEGGRCDDRDRPRRRRYTRLDSHAGVSYQSFACVSDMPQEWVFPGGLGEWLHRLDDLDFGVDWVQRLRIVDNATAQRAVTKQVRELEGQVEQYEGDPAGPPPGLDAALAANSEELATLSSHASENEVWTTTIVSCAATELADLESQMVRLQGDFAANQYGLPRPAGGQAQLLRAMLPGSSTPRVAADYRQFMLARDVASAAPFTSSATGDPTGMLLGVTADGGLPSPVLFEPSAGPANNRSGSLAMVGHLGSGKSHLLKRMMASAVLRGGQLIVLDRTDSGEYVRFARYLASDLDATTQVVTTRRDGPRVLLDPLRVFAGDRRETLAIGLVGVLTGFSPMSEQGGAIADAVRSVAGAGGALVDVVEELEALQAGDVARRVRQHARGVLGELAFGASGHQLDLSADMVVFWCPGLALPDREVQTNQHLAEQMTAEQYEAMGLLYLVAGAAQEVCFADTSRFSAFVADEVWALRANLHGDQLLSSMIRDGRKHNAAVWAGTQTPTELLGGGLVDLMPQRFVFRQAPEQATAALKLIGIDPSEEMCDLVSADDGRTGLATGECLFRDLEGRIGRVQSLAGETDRFRAAVETNPARVRELAVDDRFADLFRDDASTPSTPLVPVSQPVHLESLVEPASEQTAPPSEDDLRVSVPMRVLPRFEGR